MIYQLNGACKISNCSICHAKRRRKPTSYSNRFFSPVFYLIEMTWPYNYAPVNPVSLPIIILGLCGLGLVCLPKKKTRYFLAHLVHSSLRFLHFCSKQTMALCRSRFSRFWLFQQQALSFFLYGRIHTWKPQPDRT